MSSFEGVLDVLNNRKSPRAAVYDARTHRAVTVYYNGAELAVRVRELFGRRVSVAGELSRNQQGQPLSMRLTAIDPLPDLTPSGLASLAGMAPAWLQTGSVRGPSRTTSTGPVGVTRMSLRGLPRDHLSRLVPLPGSDHRP